MFGLLVFSIAFLYFFVHISGEGQKKYIGFNFYPISEWKHSLGFTFVYWKTNNYRGAIYFRWSVLRKRFFFKHIKMDKATIKYEKELFNS